MVGRSEGLSLNEGHSTSDGLNTTDAHGANEQHSDTSGQAFQRGQNVAYPGSGGPPSVARSDGVSDSAAHTTGGGTSQTHSEGQSHATTDSQSLGLQASRQTSATQTAGTSAGTTQTGSLNIGVSETSSDTVSHATALGHSNGSTASWGTATSDTEQRGTSRGVSSSDSTAVAIAVGTRFRPVEDTEKTDITWNLAEQRYRQACDLKNLPRATAVVRIENGPVHLTQIDRVCLPPIRPKYTAAHHRMFRQDVIDAHPDCYLPWDEARYEIEQRQLAVFQTTFSLGFPEPVEEPAAPAGTPPPVALPTVAPGTGPLLPSDPATAFPADNEPADDDAPGELPAPGWTPFENLS